jgi:hypothetical protein
MFKSFLFFAGLLIVCFLQGCSSSVSSIETPKNATFRATVPVFGDSVDAVLAANEKFSRWQISHPGITITNQKSGYEDGTYFLTVGWEKMPAKKEALSVARADGKFNVE